MADELKKIAMGKLLSLAKKGLAYAKKNPGSTALNTAMFAPMLMPAKKQTQQQAGRAAQQAV